MDSPLPHFKQTYFKELGTYLSDFKVVPVGFEHCGFI